MPSPREGFDAGNEEHVVERKVQAKTYEANRLDGLRQMLESVNGRIWLWELLSTCGIRRTPYVADSASRTDFNCGMANVGLMIEADLVKNFPKGYLQMLMERSNNG